MLVIDPNAPGKFLKSTDRIRLRFWVSTPQSLEWWGGDKQPRKSPGEVPMAMVGIVPTKLSAENQRMARSSLAICWSLHRLLVTR